MGQTLEDQIKLLVEKIDRILMLLEGRHDSTLPRTTKKRASKPRSTPLEADEIARHQSRFEKLFEAWDAGEELKVQKELDSMDAVQLRRFADANNLNITTKTSKQKTLQLIAGRFRERRQLIRSHFNRQPPRA